MNEDERSTHFQGFANLQYPELARLFLALYTARVLGDEQQATQAEQMIKEYLAQSASDLVLHTLLNVEHAHLDVLSLTEHVERIPDLTNWSELDFWKKP